MAREMSKNWRKFGKSRAPTVSTAKEELQEDPETVEMPKKSSKKQSKKKITKKKVTKKAVKAVSKALVVPSMALQVKGKVEVTGFEEVEGKLIEFINTVDLIPKTEHDFAIAEKTVKYCHKVEERLIDTKNDVTASLQSVNDTFERIDNYHKLYRDTRLSQEKSVKARKLVIKKELIEKYEDELEIFLEEGNNSIDTSVHIIKDGGADMLLAAKGAKNTDEMETALIAELERAKGVLNDRFDLVKLNVSYMADKTEYHFLFPDLHELVLSEIIAFQVIIDDRIDHYEIEEAKKEEEKEKEEGREALFEPVMMVGSDADEDHRTNEEEVISDKSSDKQAIIQWLTMINSILPPDVYNTNLAKKCKQLSRSLEELTSDFDDNLEEFLL